MPYLVQLRTFASNGTQVDFMPGYSLIPSILDYLNSLLTTPANPTWIKAFHLIWGSPNHPRNGRIVYLLEKIDSCADLPPVHAVFTEVTEGQPDNFHAPGDTTTNITTTGQS